MFKTIDGCFLMVAYWLWTIQKLSSYSANFQQVKNLVVILLTFGRLSCFWDGCFLDSCFDDDIAGEHLFFADFEWKISKNSPFWPLQGTKMIFRYPPTFWLALSLKSRQTPHTLQALLLFTFLKCYDVKLVMLP